MYGPPVTVTAADAEGATKKIEAAARATADTMRITFTLELISVGKMNQLSNVSSSLFSKWNSAYQLLTKGRKSSSLWNLSIVRLADCPFTTVGKACGWPTRSLVWH